MLVFSPTCFCSCEVEPAAVVKFVSIRNVHVIHFTVGLWGLVNNAGVCQILPIEWTPLSTFKSTADVNLWGMIDMTKTFLPLVKKARGRVVNISSGSGKENKKVCHSILIALTRIASNSPFYSCVPSDLAFEWKRGLSYPCIDTNPCAHVNAK